MQTLTTVAGKLQIVHNHSPGNHADLAHEDKVFIISQYYAGKSASEIQRKFKRDRKTMFSLPTVSMWLHRLKAEFQSSCKLERKVSVGVIISHYTHTSCSM